MSEAAAPVVKAFRVDELEAADYNPRAISEESLRGLKESLARFGLVELPVVNVHEGRKRLIGGHQRVKVLRAQGVKMVDCVEVDFDDAQEIAANLALNNPATQGDFDPVKSIALLDRVIPKLPMPDFAGFHVLEQDLRDRVARTEARKQEQNAEPAAPPTVDIVSQVGECYRLGRHRLYCGSFTAGIPLLCKGGSVDACLTDPPYNVAYQQDSTGALIENDDLDSSDWRAFLSDFTRLVLGACKGACYVFMSSSGLPDLEEAWVQHGGRVHRWLAWVKDTFTLSRGDYHHQFELVLYGARRGVRLAAPAEARPNVLVFPKPRVNALHPTMKPTELVRLLMLDSTKPGQTVLDPCAGSGTTLVVAESVGRTCFACELDPAFSDVIRKRWAEMAHGVGCDWVALTPVD